MQYICIHVVEIVGILGYLDRGMAVSCCMPSRDVPVLLGNPRILGQGYGCVLLYAIPGCTWDSHGLLGNPGILGQGYGCVVLYAIQGC